MEGVALVRRRDRLHPFRRVLGEVLHGEKAAVRLAVVHDGLGDRTLVERVTTALGQRAERSGQVLLDEDRACRRCAAVDEERGRGGRRFLQLADLGNPVLRDLLRDGKPILGECNRRLEQIDEPHRAVFLEQRHPRVHRPGYGDRGHAGRRHSRQVLRREVIERERARRAASRVERLERLRLRPVDHRERVAADARHVRFGDVERRSHGNGRVSGVAAALQDIKADLGREWLARRDHAVRRSHDRPAGAEPRIPVASRRRGCRFARGSHVRCLAAGLTRHHCHHHRHGKRDQRRDLVLHRLVLQRLRASDVFGPRLCPMLELAV